MEGYKIKSGKETTYCAPGQDRPTKGKTIGTDYTNEGIRRRIENKGAGQNTKTNPAPDSQNSKKRDKRNINLLVDISKNVKAQKSKGYEHALVRANINTMVKTINYLQNNGMSTVDELVEKINESEALRDGLGKNMKDMDMRRKQLSEKIKFSQNYVKYKKIALTAKKKPLGDAFHTEYKNEILAYNVAAIYMEKNSIDTSWLDIKGMIAEHKEMLADKKILKSEYDKISEKLGELHLIRQNVETILDISISEESSRQPSDKKISKDQKEQDTAR
ncbi:hypothetical protein IMSAGC009_01990 [Lachnospiraceae bacterium]|nr:hypothetical protein IMSAGC009_01990 [Lachnospiraceae bacterium]